ncbi:MAG TPA: polyketide synthase, partial [Saprospiraceae bacterium]|nr:polyketide synthase [Saprospiraceae bacterium]
MDKKEKIAVIGMGGLFPGSETVEQFWENLVGNKDLVTNARFEDFGADPALFFHEDKGKLDHCYALRGGFIRNFKFDATGYRLDAGLLNCQDNQFKWSLYVAKAALQDSGYYQHPSLDKCGVIVGNLSFPTRYSRQILSPVYAGMAREVLEDLSGQEVPVPAGNTRYPADIQHTLLTNAPAALIAQALGLRATHYSLDAACASSLYAVKLACDELQTRKADLMLAGAVSGADPLFIHMGFSYFHAYARQNEVSAPMDVRSGGLTSAEGAGMVVLKRLSDARRDGDRILAVIEGVGLSNDGKGKFLLSPNPKGQKLAFERAYSQTDLRPEAMDYLECHATGTPLGDKTEFNSIGDFFVRDGAEPPLVGSVKSNMGHLLTAAGMAGMIKVILS